MRYEVDMLNVGAADAVLLHFYMKEFGDAEREYIVLIDAGNEGDGEKVISHIRAYYDKACIDLAICTHCDSDHFGGFKDLVLEHQNPDSDFRIKEMWIHDPTKHVTPADVKYVRKQDSVDERLAHLFDLKDGNNLLSMIDGAGIPCREVFAGDKNYAMNLSVLGPTREFYESLVRDFRHDLDFYSESDVDDADENGIEGTVLSRALEDAEDDASAQNQSSIIVSFTAGKDVLLFTGDAGRKALKEVMNRDVYGELQNLTYLKAPHHGSKHNLNSEIINYFCPISTYISAESYSRFANKCTVNALKKVGRVYSTMNNGSLCYPSSAWKVREGYTVATPL